MKENKLYKQNVAYVLRITHSLACGYYIGSHCRSRSIRPSELILTSGNPINCAHKKGLVSLEDYKKAIEVIQVEEYDTKEEAQAREIQLISDYKERFGNLCLNRAAGNKYSTKGIKQTEEAKRHMAQAHGVNGVLQFDKQGNFINRFNSTQEAYRQTGVSQGNISAVCRGERKQAGGYFFEYEDN